MISLAAHGSCSFGSAANSPAAVAAAAGVFLPIGRAFLLPAQP